MAAPCTSAVVVCAIKNACSKHNVKTSRSFISLTTETFEDIEDLHVCTEASFCEVALAENENGPWTKIGNTDSMFKSPVLSVVNSFGTKFI